MSNAEHALAPMPLSLMNNAATDAAATSPSSLQPPTTSGSSTPAVCGIASYDSRLMSSTYPRLGGFYASSPYGDQPNYMSAFSSGTSSFYPSLVSNLSGGNSLFAGCRE